MSSFARRPSSRLPTRLLAGLHKVTLILCIISFILGLAYVVYYHVQVEVMPYDDAYITYRYAQNLASGNGLIYNDGQHVFGSTTPLYVLWLSGLKSLIRSVPLPVLAVRGNALFYVLSAVALVGLVRQLGVDWIGALLAGHLFSVQRTMLDLSSAGMETYLFIALMLGALWALCAGRWRLAGILTGLVAVTRPEGIFILGIFFLGWVQRSRRPLALAAGIAPGILWTVFATLYYGNPIPHSIIARMQPIYLLPGDAAMRSLVGQVTNWLQALAWLPMAGALQRLIAVGLTVAAIVGVFRRPLRQRGGWALGLLASSFLLFYPLTNAFPFGWYYPPIYALWLVSLLAGLPNLLAPSYAGESIGDSAAGTSHKQNATWRSVLHLGLTLFVLVLCYPVQAGNLTRGLAHMRQPSVRDAQHLRLEVYKEAARWLNGFTTPETTVASPEIGALGFYFHGHIYDACGLVSPEALPHLPVPLAQRGSGTDGTIGNAFARAVQADLTVSMTTFSWKSIDRDPWFQAHYTLIRRMPLPEPLWGAEEVLIYARNDWLAEHNVPEKPGASG